MRLRCIYWLTSPNNQCASNPFSGLKSKGDHWFFGATIFLTKDLFLIINNICSIVDKNEKANSFLNLYYCVFLPYLPVYPGFHLDSLECHRGVRHALSWSGTGFKLPLESANDLQLAHPLLRLQSMSRLMRHFN